MCVHARVCVHIYISLIIKNSPRTIITCLPLLALSPRSLGWKAGGQVLAHSLRSITRHYRVHVSVRVCVQLNLLKSTGYFTYRQL